MNARQSTWTLAFLLALAITRHTSGAPVFLGKFHPPDWFNHFNYLVNPPWQLGADRSSVLLDSDRKSHVLKVRYPKGMIDSEPSGASWLTYLGKKYDSLSVSYYVKFEQGFTFVKGGKLPGLIGGHRSGLPHSTLTGGYKPSGQDGWSARVMWRREGRIVQYVYHPDQADKWGDDFPWMIHGKPATFTPGRWHHLKTEITMNKPGVRDGVIRSWLDGVKALEVSNIRFRDIASIGIDALYFSTFFGGDAADWAPPKDVFAFFDQFEVE